MQDSARMEDRAVPTVHTVADLVTVAAGRDPDRTARERLTFVLLRYAEAV